MVIKYLDSKNKLYGFWGTTSNYHEEQDVKERWDSAFQTLLELSGKEPEKIQEYLDSRLGRHLADECYGKDVKDTILKDYFRYYEKQLFEDSGRGIINKDKSEFGKQVYNKITKTTDILLYTFQKPNRIYMEYASCINSDCEIYDIGVRFIEIF